jgi:toxin ParE1/3/4
VTLWFRSRAERELDEAEAWYDERRPGLGLEFLDEVGVVLARIDVDPAQFPKTRSGVRRALLRRFPFAIYFIDDDATDRVVLAVLHQATSPDRVPRR